MRPVLLPQSLGWDQTPPKIYISKTPAAPETLMVAETGGSAKVSLLAVGLSLTLCDGLNKSISAVL